MLNLCNPSKISGWLKVSLLLSIFGFLKEIRPSEPFIYEFLTGKWRNVTEDQVNQDVYPVGTYSTFVHTVIVFLITDLSRYKPLIVILGCSGIIVWSMLLWTTSLLGLQIVEVFYGTFCATEVAYFTYIYAKVDTEYFPQVTSHTRAAILAGRAISGIMAQLLISFDVMDYKQLNYITFAAMVAATIWSLFLPPVKKSIYFHQENMLNASLAKKFFGAFSLMFSHFWNAYSNRYVIIWSIWWVVSTCGFIQAQTYMQPLWKSIVDDPDKHIYNGAVESGLTVLGFLGALLAGSLKFNWKLKGVLALTLCSLLQGCILIISSQTKTVEISYVCYILFGGLFHLFITVTSSEIAKYIEEDSYGLVFGINTFVALALQAILTTVVVKSGVGFGLEPKAQYFVYGVFHIVLAAFYIIIGLIGWFMSKEDH